MTETRARARARAHTRSNSRPAARAPRSDRVANVRPCELPPRRAPAGSSAAPCDAQRGCSALATAPRRPRARPRRPARAAGDALSAARARWLISSALAAAASSVRVSQRASRCCSRSTSRWRRCRRRCRRTSGASASSPRRHDVGAVDAARRSTGCDAHRAEARGWALPARARVRANDQEVRARASSTSAAYRRCRSRAPRLRARTPAPLGKERRGRARVHGAGRARRLSGAARPRPGGDDKWRAQGVIELSTGQSMLIVARARVGGRGAGLARGLAGAARRPRRGTRREPTAWRWARPAASRRCSRPAPAERRLLFRSRRTRWASSDLPGGRRAPTTAQRCWRPPRSPRSMPRSSAACSPRGCAGRRQRSALARAAAPARSAARRRARCSRPPRSTRAWADARPRLHALAARCGAARRAGRGSRSGSRAPATLESGGARNAPRARVPPAVDNVDDDVGGAARDDADDDVVTAGRRCARAARGSRRAAPPARAPPARDVDCTPRAARRRRRGVRPLVTDTWESYNCTRRLLPLLDGVPDVGARADEAMDALVFAWACARPRGRAVAAGCCIRPTAQRALRARRHRARRAFSLARSQPPEPPPRDDDARGARAKGARGRSTCCARSRARARARAAPRTLGCLRASCAPLPPAAQRGSADAAASVGGDRGRRVHGERRQRWLGAAKARTRRRGGGA